MTLTPEDIARQRFPMTLRRGYEKEEVDRFLATVAADYIRVSQKLEEATARAGESEARLSADPAESAPEEVRAILVAARESAQRILRKARIEADEITRAVERAGMKAEEETGRRIEAEFAIAREKANEIIGSAQHEASTTRTTAEKQCLELLDEAKALHQWLTAHEAELVESVVAAETPLHALKGELGLGFPDAEAKGQEPHATVIRLEQERRGADGSRR